MSRSTFTQHQAMILLVCVVFMGLMHVAEAGSTLHVNDLFLSYITISAIGLVINIGSLAILSTIRSKYVQLTLLNIGTNILDVIYLIILLIINVNSYQHASHYSLTFSEAGCDADVICAITFTIWSITLVVGLSFIAKRDLWDGVKYSVAEIIGLELATGLYALGAALAVTFMTDNGTTLDDSLSYCILSRHNSLPYIISIALLTVPVLFMVYNIYLIFLSIQYAQDLLDTSGIVIIAKQQQYESMKKLSYIILTKILFCIPVVASDFIRIVKGETNPSLSAISGIIITLVPAIVDPIVYLLINEDLQKKAKDIWDNFRLWSSVRVSYIADESNWNSPCNKKLKDWKYWMGNETRREILLDYAKQEYVFENFLFYDDVVKYRELGTELKVLVDTIPPNRQTILQKWSEFSKYANKIYTLFIQVSPHIVVDCKYDCIACIMLWPVILLTIYLVPKL